MPTTMPEPIHPWPTLTLHAEEAARYPALALLTGDRIHAEEVGLHHLVMPENFMGLDEGGMILPGERKPSLPYAAVLALAIRYGMPHRRFKVADLLEIIRARLDQEPVARSLRHDLKLHTFESVNYLNSVFSVPNLVIALGYYGDLDLEPAPAS